MPYQKFNLCIGYSSVFFDSDRTFKDIHNYDDRGRYMYSKYMNDAIDIFMIYILIFEIQDNATGFL